MKKYLLLGTITLAGILNFSSANDILFQSNYTCKSSECEDNLISFRPSTDDVSLGTNLCYEYGFFSDYSDPSSISYTYSYNFPDYENWYEGEGNGDYSNVVCSSNREYDKEYGIDFWGLSPSGDYNFTNYFKVYEYADGGEGGEGGNIVAGGISAFSGIIDRLGGIFGEFGPYIIYIAIACLGISLLFKALKYILGFTNNSAKNSIGGNRESRKKRKFNKFIGMRNRRNRRRFNRRHRNRSQRYNKIRYKLNERR